MKLVSWLKRWQSIRAIPMPRRAVFRPGVEFLEDRLAPATLHVTNLNGNTSSGSLRGQIAAASAGDTIVFDLSGTITLGGAASINKDLIIDAGGQSIIVSGGTFFPVFIINAGTVTIDDLSIVNGNGANNGSQGGGVYNGSTATATLNNVTIANCRSNGGNVGNGGGIFNAGALTMTNCTVANNTAPNGGGIYNLGALNLIHNTITGNTAEGILIAETAGITSSVFIGNTIVAGNTGTDLVRSGGAAMTSGGGNVYGTDVQGSWLTNASYPDIQTASPRLGTLQNNGGTVSTIALLSGSPALGAGNPNDPSFDTLPATDQRGMPRVYHCITDSGAFQNQSQYYDLTTPTMQPSATAGSATFFNLGSFSYAGSAASWSVNVAWGDGGADSAFTVASAGALPAQSHTYALAGTYTATITLTADGNFKEMTTTIIVIPALAALTVATSSLPVATVGNAYFQLITASGGSGGYSFSASSTLPAGLSLSTAGVLSGTPTAAFGPTNITVQVTDSAGNSTTGDVSLTVHAAIVLTPATLPAFSAHVFYLETVSASGGSGSGYSYAVTSGALPDGLTLDAGTGELSGTPPAWSSVPAVFTITATDSNSATGCQVYALTGARMVNLGDLSFDQWTRKREIDADALAIAVTGGTGTYTLTSVTGLPRGINATLDGNTIALGGTPTRAGSFTIKVAVADSDGVTASRNYSFKVDHARTLTWTGLGGDAFWSNPDNWTGAAPVAGNSLIFGDLADQKANINDLAANSKLKSLVFQDGGYALSGNAITLTGGLKATSASSVDASSVDLDMTLTSRETFKVQGTNAIVLAGNLSGSKGGIIKTGAGMLILAGENSYAKSTAVKAGTLLAANSAGSATGTALVTVARNATLAGAGSVGPVKIRAGGALMSDVATTGQLGAGNIRLESGSVYGATLGGTIAGVGYDQLIVTGNVRLSGSVLQTNLTFAPAVLDTFTLIDNDDTDAVVGHFKGLTEGNQFTVDGSTFQISYVGGDGNDVVLTRIL